MDAPQIKRPIGISALSALLMAAAIALLVRTIQLHKSGMAGLSRLLAVLIIATIAVGLWKLKNGARIFLFFLIVLDVLCNLIALFLYALRMQHYRLAVELVIELAVAALLIWYLQRAEVKHAFGGLSAWPRTV
ncbi:MAG TPA: hypothetical protein VKD65_04400, partial [Candidatus Angelobacter sp.]|nr:hypothetical protein [Candidatus Angelobacter sp.]